MKLYIMKRESLEMLKANLPLVYGKYFTESTNKWITDICGEDPFIEFKDVTAFKLAELNSDLTPGEIDLNNCKTIYEKLGFLSESQASDERLWAGLTHSTFYEYMRRRWGYGYGKKPQSAIRESGAIKTRFFYNGTGRSGFYRNTLAKCWWVGHNTYDSTNAKNPFEYLDIIGSNDLNSKISEFFRNYTFSSNPYVMKAIIEVLRRFKEEGRQLLVRDHIRPALSHLNAVGGSVIIDCLPQEEITEIFYDTIEAIMQGDEPAIHLEVGLSKDDIDLDDLETEDINIEDNKLEVTLGCKIIIRNEDKETKTYKYDLVNGKLPTALEVFTGHRIGDIVIIQRIEWKIEDIVL